MEVVTQLSAFYELVQEDPRIGPTHICVYMALLHERYRSRANPFSAVREKLMRHACVGRKTYNNRVKELSLYGYIQYEPSVDPARPSQVRLINL